MVEWQVEKLLPEVEIADLPLEVHGWTGFLDEYTHIGGTEQTREEGLIETLSALLVSESGSTPLPLAEPGGVGRWPPPTGCGSSSPCPPSTPPTTPATSAGNVAPRCTRGWPIPRALSKTPLPQASDLQRCMRDTGFWIILTDSHTSLGYE